MLINVYLFISMLFIYVTYIGGEKKGRHEVETAREKVQRVECIRTPPTGEVKSLNYFNIRVESPANAEPRTRSLLNSTLHRPFESHSDASGGRSGGGFPGVLSSSVDR